MSGGIVQIRDDWSPLSSQRGFMESDRERNSYVGGVGSGKTTVLCKLGIYMLMKHSGLRALLVRLTEDELLKTTVKEFFKLCPKEVLVGGGWNQAQREVRFINGSVLWYAPGDIGKGAFDKLGRGLEIGLLLIDEGTELEEELYQMLHTRLRQAGMPRRSYLVSNPNGKDWVWRLFYSGDSDKELYFGTISKTCDNPYLPAGYEDNLRRSMPERWVQRYLDASFDEFSGLIYPDFRESIHCIERFDIEEYERTLGMRGLRFRAIDHGYTNPTVCLWGWVHPKVLNADRSGWHKNSGAVYIYREYWMREQIVSFNASMVNEMTGAEDIKITYIDPSCYNTDARDGNNIALEYSKAEVEVTPANHELVAGLNRVREYMRVNEVTGCPRLYFFKGQTPHTLTELEKYRLKMLRFGEARNPVEEPMKKDDHCMDALRYLIIGIYERELRSYDYSEEAEAKRKSRYEFLGLNPQIDLGNLDEAFDTRKYYEDNYPELLVGEEIAL